MTKKSAKELRAEFEVYFADLKAEVENDGGSVSKPADLTATREKEREMHIAYKDAISWIATETEFSTPQELAIISLTAKLFVYNHRKVACDISAYRAMEPIREILTNETL